MIYAECDELAHVEDSLQNGDCEMETWELSALDVQMLLVAWNRYIEEEEQSPFEVERNKDLAKRLASASARTQKGKFILFFVPE